MTNLKFGYQRMKIPAKVGSRSLVGTIDIRPSNFGNYFSFQDGDPGNPFGGVRCVNMWAENLEDAREKFNLQDGVFVDVYEDEGVRWAVVNDDRIGKEWMNQYCYFCGCRSMPMEMIRELHTKYGWDDERMLEYYDPEAYHAKRGYKYTATSNGYFLQSMES